MKHQAKKQTRSQHMPVVIVCILILVLAVMGLECILLRNIFLQKKE